MLSLIFASFCLFTPPEDWEIAHPKTPAKRALLGFVKTKKSGFCPSIHLTYEKIDISMDQYLDLIQKSSLSKRQKWRKLGDIQTKSGKAKLLEIETRTPFGLACILQALLFTDQEVHILTAGTLKKNLSEYLTAIQKAFSSMQICTDLFALSQDPEGLRKCWKKRDKDIESYRKRILNESHLGPVWQIFMNKTVE